MLLDEEECFEGDGDEGEETVMIRALSPHQRGDDLLSQECKSLKSVFKAALASLRRLGVCTIAVVVILRCENEGC
jgi:hypothetical protein